MANLIQMTTTASYSDKKTYNLNQNNHLNPDITDTLYILLFNNNQESHVKSNNIGKPNILISTPDILCLNLNQTNQVNPDNFGKPNKQLT